MKTILKLLAVLTALAGVVSACEGTDATTDQALTLSKEAVTLAPEGGSETVVLVAPVAWVATPSAEWLKVNPASGDAGTFNLSVSADKNASGQDRSGMLTISAGSKSATLSVSQKAYSEEQPQTPDTMNGYGADVNDWDQGGDSSYHKD